MHRKLLPHDIKIGYRPLIAILVVGMLMLHQVYASGTNITGTVIGVRGDTVIFEVTSGPAPSVGDIAELSFKLGGEQFSVGTWRVTRLAGKQYEAVRIKADLDAATGMSVRIVAAAGAATGQAAPRASREQTLQTIAVPTRATPVPMTSLRAITTGSYRLVWKDAGSGARRDFGVWRPAGRDGFYPLGDVANASPWRGKRYPAPAFETLLVRGGKPPVGYRRVWNTAGSHADRPFSSWTPVAPPGYRCLGDVGSASADAMPPLDAIRCLPQRCVVETELKQKIWDDTGSGARLDFSAWLIPGVNVYAGNGSHKKPGGEFYTINPACM